MGASFRVFNYSQAVLTSSMYFTLSSYARFCLLRLALDLDMLLGALADLRLLPVNKTLLVPSAHRLFFPLEFSDQAERFVRVGQLGHRGFGLDRFHYFIECGNVQMPVLHIVVYRLVIHFRLYGRSYLRLEGTAYQQFWNWHSFLTCS